MSTIPFGPSAIINDRNREALVRTGDAKALFNQNRIILRTNPGLEANWTTPAVVSDLTLSLFPNMDGSWQLRGLLEWTGGTLISQEIPIIDLSSFVGVLGEPGKGLIDLRVGVTVFDPSAFTTMSAAIMGADGGPNSLIILAVGPAGINANEQVMTDMRVYFDDE